ncbi:D-alanyl-D-alanine carboxypeptidase family protein [Brevibacillus brevis]|uniref:D-alanyl-D-alanine carboxypeptidase family protein n=1 Tax=Brevibacillus brevis TaxID=1393 RepID=UPI0007D8C5DF|nr:MULTISPECIES: D-alanyl-D-alanine carboxypeptidase family protein [Bacillales]MBH0329313.1 D-alanyl-D-alanine carboxypeptidase [Brevibacillus brevis]TQR37776.1 D-alanyl-D-alanine carboxypeptidase [Lysinibacillus sp. SDF0063]UIO44773.1 D-alanyl-D-alanine carboxypeptidase [Brevibacillus brevis]WGV62441.1 D-alanyl-D-alanine carboxypeptidase family protein [Brevibacillus brevis]
MKRNGYLALCFLMCFTIFSPMAIAKEKAGQQKSDNHFAPQASSAVMIEADTGTVLYEKNANEKMPPASITKVMTMLLIMEAVERGELKLTDKVRTSERAASMGGSQIFLQPGEEMTVEDMLKGIAIASGNDASVAMAEHLAGTEESFVTRMNERAQQLGMKNTHFVNSNGLPAANHYSSAGDIAIMSRELLKHEGITKFTGTYQDYLRKDTESPFWLVNTNKLVRFYEGVDGLKTGYTGEAKYCLTATAKRNNMRVIAVVLGEPDVKTRNNEVSTMFNYAFTHFQVTPMYKKGEPVRTLVVDKGQKSQINAVTPHAVSLLMKKGESADTFQKEIVIKEAVHAPIAKNQVIGHIFIRTKDGKEVNRIDLFPEDQVDKANMWEILKRTTKSILISY